MMNYVAAILGGLLIAALISAWYYKGEYEEAHKDYIAAKASAENLSVAIDAQNEQIDKLRVDNEKFRRDYQSLVLEPSTQVVQKIERFDVNTCNDILQVIESLN